MGNSVADVQKALTQTKNNIIRIAGVDEQGTYLILFHLTLSIFHYLTNFHSG